MALWLQVLVQLPLALTGHMIYVDIGWPLGLVLMALQGTHAAAPAYSDTWRCGRHPRCRPRARMVGIRIAHPTTERLVWHCGARTAKTESFPRGQFLITKTCCFLWHVDWRVSCVPATRGRA